MMLGTLIQDVKVAETVEPEKIVSEILEIMSMIEAVKRRIVEAVQNSSTPNSDMKKLEELLQTLRIEMVKRSILLANKQGIRLPSTPALLNGGSRGRVNDNRLTLDDFSRLEEELNQAYRAARETLNNLSRLV